jgi:FlaA1/EpsC-like NDP-sugar epimerase
MIILGLPRPVKRLLAFSLDAALCVLAAWFALALRLESLDPFSKASLLPVATSVALALPIFIAFGLYKAIFRYSGREALLQLAFAVGLYGAVYFILFSLVGFNGVPRSIGLAQPTLLFFLVGASRWLVGRWLGQAIAKGEKASWPGVIIYGAGEAGRQLADAVAASTQRRFIAFIDDQQALWDSTIDGRKVFAPSRLAKLIAQTGATELWLAIPSMSGSERKALIESLHFQPIRVLTLPSISDLTSGKVRISDVRELNIDELLGRELVKPDMKLLDRDLRDKVVVVTGAGGSIGSELCKQIVECKPAKLLLVDHSEFSLYSIHAELVKLMRKRFDLNFEDAEIAPLVPLLCSVGDSAAMTKIFQTWKPHTVYHAAAYKHVPLVEHNPAQAILNNVWGTLICAQCALEVGTQKFVLVSTDKAVRPTNLMGASKRLAEMVLQALDDASSHLREPAEGGRGTAPIFTMVRFGNVLNSSGSVVPLFRSQITEGGPVTVTHPEVTRYFMTIPEAAQLVIQAGAMAQGGEVFVLDMGEPVKLMDLARRMVELSGFSVRDPDNPRGDIEIEITGLRPGEKLYEELLIGNDPQPTKHSRIKKAQESCLKWVQLEGELEQLNALLARNDIEALRVVMARLVSGFTPHNEIVDWIYVQERGLPRPSALQE